MPPLVLRPAEIAASRRGLVTGATTRLTGLLVATVLLVGLMVLSVAVGSKPISIGTVLDAVFSYNNRLEDHVIVHVLRIPRTVVGLEVGVALGMSGAVMQGIARNPLADPGLLGVNAGASLFVVLTIWLFGVTSLLGYVWVAFAGAGIAAVVVYAVGSLGREGATPVKLALAGAAITTFLGSVTTAILLLNISTANQLRLWAVGSLAGRTLEIAAQLAPFIIAGALLALACGPAVNTLALGDDTARGLGQRVVLTRAVGAATVVLLCGAATAAAGPIGFIGLVVPHVARIVTGPDYRWVLPYSMILAPCLLLVSDILGRIVIRPVELPVGIVTAALGAPFFVWLVRRPHLSEL